MSLRVARRRVKTRGGRRSPRQVAEGLGHRYALHTAGVVWRGTDLRVRPELLAAAVLTAFVGPGPPGPEEGR